MTLQELLEVYNGQFIEMAGTVAQNQCVDLANSYIKYVLRLPMIEFTNAVDFPSKAGDKYEYIINTPTGVPQEGDLVIWGGTYGHIAIFIEGNATRFTSFDQNYPTGSPCHVQEHTYLSPKVLGWIRPKAKPVSLQGELDKCVNDRNAHWDTLIAIASKLKIETSPTLILAEIDKFLTYEEKIRGYEGQLTDVQSAALKLEQELVLKVKALEDEKSQNATLTVEVANSQKRIETLLTEIKGAQEAIQSLKNDCKPVVYTGWKKILYDMFFS